ncbi:MAG: esterase [Gammaproteobacteria bacterium]|nr:esterase [Gammaproteobacteria bacterium]
MIIYIHGFNSSAASYKAQVLLKHFKELGREDEIIIPSLSSIPAYAMAELKALVEQNINKNLSFIGSSLGGYYATWLADRYDRPAVLINPAVKPYDLLKDYLGKNINHYSGEEYELTAEHIEELKDLDIEYISKPHRYLVMLQTGDEVLDYSQAFVKFAGSRMIVEEGGDHSFSSFESHLDTILNFCGVHHNGTIPT